MNQTDSSYGYGLIHLVFNSLNCNETASSSEKCQLISFMFLKLSPLASGNFLVTLFLVWLSSFFLYLGASLFLTAPHQEMSFLSILKLFLEPMIITSLIVYLKLKKNFEIFFSFLHLSFVKEEYASYLVVISMFLNNYFFYQFFLNVLSSNTLFTAVISLNFDYQLFWLYQPSNV